MEWTRSRYGYSYSVTIGMSEALVWMTSTGKWSASVYQDSSAIAQDMFTNVKDAQAWCEAQIAASK